MNLNTRKLHPDFGVEVLGVDLRADLNRTLVDDILDAYYTHSVLLFRDQDLSAPAQAELTRQFGSAKVFSKMRFAREDAPEVSRLGNIRANDGPAAFYNRQGVEWHSDGAGEPDTDRATLLYAVEVPARGGDTMFCSMHAAYETLSSALKARIADRQVLHSFMQHNDRVLAANPAAFTPLTPEQRAAYPDMWEDLVQVHPVTGRLLYYISLNLVKEITGLNGEESIALAEQLLAHATLPERVYRHHWVPGDLVIWDNRATMHSPTDPKAYQDLRRLMHRSCALTHPEQWMARYGADLSASRARN